MADNGGLFIRLYLDEDIHKRAAVALRLRQFDVVSVHELALQTRTDEEQLVNATQQSRSIVTFNTYDFIQLHVQWMNEGRSHAGIIVSEQLPVGETIRRLLNLLNTVSMDEIHNQLLWLQSFK